MAKEVTTYKGYGASMEEAFMNILESLRYSDNMGVRKEKDGRYGIMLKVVEPTDEQRHEFEKDSSW